MNQSLRMICIECAMVHQGLATDMIPYDEEFAAAERRAAVDAFSDADEAARRQRESAWGLGLTWTRGVLDC